MHEIKHGDCREIMASMEPESVDSIVTDPPYGLSFMGKGWDHGVPGVEFWTEALRVAKPGAYLLAFGGTRTFHRLAVATEDAGWEIRDTVMWVYGSGFPKSHDVSKAIDKAAGAKREVVGSYTVSNDIRGGNLKKGSASPLERDITTPATEAARQWQGWGTALKPSWEPVIVARKPFKDTVAANVLAHGTGAINVDRCRVGMMTSEEVARSGRSTYGMFQRGGVDWKRGGRTPQGRWPANLIHDGSDEVGDLLGSAARFFYCAKASKRDRGESNHHPTVKPTDLMRYLCRLVTQPGGVVLDPFCGSGSTGKGAVLEGFGFIGIEREAEYVEIARARVTHAQKNPRQGAGGR